MQLNFLRKNQWIVMALFTLFAHVGAHANGLTGGRYLRVLKPNACICWKPFSGAVKG